MTVDKNYDCQSLSVLHSHCSRSLSVDLSLTYKYNNIKHFK